jgi:hypothetical protein
MNILENIKPCGEIPLWQKTLITSKKKVKNSKGLNFSTIKLETNLYNFFFMKERKIENPPRYIPFKPYQKKS